MKRALVVLFGLLVFVVPASAGAFCGFYVGSAGTSLYNDATQVVLLRDGTKTVVSMQNDYRGPTRDFAMVVPVPEVLQKENVKTLEKEVFDRVDRLSAPRLVEYWEQDPCQVVHKKRPMGIGTGARGGSGYGRGIGDLGGGTVTVEAEFAVGEYDIVILSTDQARALERWLKQNDYAIPKGAAPYFRPYVEGGSYFFVAKVDPDRATFEEGRAVLSPLRFHYTDEHFRLPVRLGLINSSGEQDLLVYILANNQRYELANYDNVMIPTNLEVAPDVKDRFGEFYEALFSRTVEENPGAFVTEYAWAVGPGKCDPCPATVTGLSPGQMYTLGVDVTGQVASSYSVVPGKADVSGGQLDREIIRRVVRRHRRELKQCADRHVAGGVPRTILKFRIDGDGNVTEANYSVGSGGDSALVECVESKVNRWVFPEPKDQKAVDVSYPLMMRPVITSNMSGWTLTRIHGRYDSDSLGEDLVFRKAEPIVGGREHQSDRDRYGANPASVNTFQGRYIIRHEWDGPVDCENPVFGRWGGPPSGDESKVKAAASRNTTGDEPKALELGGGTVRKGPEGLATEPPPTPEETRDEESDPKVGTEEPDEPAPSADRKPEQKNCSCSVHRRGAIGGWAFIIAVVAMTACLRRRRLTPS